MLELWKAQILPVTLKVWRDTPTELGGCRTLHRLGRLLKRATDEPGPGLQQRTSFAVQGTLLARLEVQFFRVSQRVVQAKPRANLCKSPKNLISFCKPLFESVCFILNLSKPHYIWTSTDNHQRLLVQNPQKLYRQNAEEVKPRSHRKATGLHKSDSSGSGSSHHER